MAAGVLYRSELAHGLAARLGLRMSPLRGWFELNGVPREIIEAFSTRRAEIEARLVAQGRSGARASEQAALHTRQRKGHFSREALFSAWRQMGEELRFSSAMAAALIAKPYVPDWNQSVGALEAAFPKALRELTGRLAHFGERDLVRSMAERVQARGLPSKVIRSFVRTRLKDRQVVALGEEMGYERFSTRSVYALETKLLEVARRSVGEGRHIVSERSLAWALSKHSTLTSEQASAVRKITAEQGSIQCLRGLAGTGKTFALGAAREAWERQGYRVVGVTLSARAARALQAGSKIESTTIASSLFRSSPSLSYILKHHGRQLVRAALKKPTYKLIRPKLDSKTVLVIDEASMVGTKDMYALLVAAAKGRAKVVLVGDDRQLQAIEGSGPYRALMKALGTAELTQITRQREPWMARAVRQFAEGDARGALSEYARRERIHLEDTPDETRERLVRDWSERRTKRLSGTLILAGTREAVTDVNARVQKARIAGGELRPSKSVQASRGKRFYEGDRVLFTKNNARLGVHNGDFGTIEKVSRRFPNRASRLTIRLDEVDDSQGLPIPIRVTIECRDAEHLDLGYAVTVHKAQGATVEQTFVLGGGWMQDRELAYVQMSRARGRTDIYATHGDAGEDLSELVRAMERSRPKELAHEVQTRGLVSARSQTRRLRR